jgi:RNA polymerase sigma-70 factor (ECF subfamily)
MTLEREALAHVDAMYNLARRLTRDDAAAEDLVQETFARAWGALASFARGSNLKAWLFRILRNAHIDSTRKISAEPRDDLDDAVVDETAAAALDDAATAKIRSLAAQDIEAALVALPEAQRIVILLDLEDLSETEIASVVGCAVGTVKSRLSRARAALRESLAQWKPT